MTEPTNIRPKFQDYWALKHGRRSFYIDPYRVPSDRDLFFGGTGLVDSIKAAIEEGTILNFPRKSYLEGSWEPVRRISCCT